MRKFINGPLEGTNLEIMPSKSASHLPDGSPIRHTDYLLQMDRGHYLPDICPAQKAHAKGEIDIHAPQVFLVESSDPNLRDRYVGPSVAQEWKILFRGERPYYRFEGSYHE